jgi:hypothetical protein
MKSSAEKVVEKAQAKVEKAVDSLNKAYDDSEEKEEIYKSFQEKEE